MEEGDARLVPWEARLAELEALDDPIDRLLADVEARMGGGPQHRVYDPSQLELFEGRLAVESEAHLVRLKDGRHLRGTWHEIVRQMRDQAGFGHETITDYMRRLAERWHEVSGVEIPFQDPENFLRAAVAANLLTLEDPE
jgi:hypothetical protein